MVDTVPPTEVAKQVGYHWKKVQKCALGKQRKSLVSVVAPILLDITKISKKNVGVQTEEALLLMLESEKD